MSFAVHRGLQRVLMGVLAATIAGVILAFAYQSWKASEQRGLVPLDRFNAVPEFSFTDQEGTTITSADLKGKIWVADFISTRGTGLFAAMSGRFAELDRNFQKSDRLKLVSFTVDPETDTIAVLKQYARGYEASDRWYFLTGEKDKLNAIAMSGFQLADQDPKSVSGNDIRTTKFALVDADGIIRAYYDGMSPEVVQKLLTDIGSLLRRGGR
jgi:protein SCO1/2